MVSRLARTLPLVSLALAFSVATTLAEAAVYFPNKTADTADGTCDGDCSLREAIVAANASAGPHVILLKDEVYTLSRAGAGEDFADRGDLDVREDVTILGVAADRTVIDGADLDRVLDVLAGAHLEIQDLTIRNGSVAGAGGGVRSDSELDIRRVTIAGNITTAAGDGGGISSTGLLDLQATTISGNLSAGNGGGVAAAERASFTNTTVAGNTAAGLGGGIFLAGDTEAPILHSTIATNQAGQRGGGIFAISLPFQASHHAELRNTIVAKNSAPQDRDCAEAVTSGGHNLIGDGTNCIDFSAAKSDLEGNGVAPLDPLLASLGDQGGTTATLALLAGSPARNAGDACAATDQRGQPRDAVCDLGAFETGGACLPGAAALCANQARFRVSATYRTASGQAGSARAVPLTADSGYFWFFDNDNIEVTAKVLDGCGLNGKYWVFLSGLTNVEVTITVTDTVKGITKVYTNPLHRVFVSQLDTSAFATCI
jgi:CSLREA domain-containing protein